MQFLRLLGLLIGRRRTCAEKLARFASQESGAIGLFSLFVFLVILTVGGLALDLMHTEFKRTRLQNALDRAVLTAAADPENAGTDFVGESLTTLGLSDQLIGVRDTSTATERQITASAEDEVGTQFPGLVGLESLSAPASAAAYVPNGGKEISMVFDISGSMRYASGGRQRIEFLRDGAGAFADRVLADDLAETTSINLVPFAGQVNPGRTLFKRLGGKRWHRQSSCKEVLNAEFMEPGLPTASGLQLPHFMEWDIDPETMDWGWCPTDEAAVRVAQNDPGRIKSYLDNIRLHDGTGTHIGLKYGLGLLDPSARAHVETLAYNGEIPQRFGNRPLPYSEATQKYLVLVTDGGVTDQSRPVGASYENVYCEDPARDDPDQTPQDTDYDGATAADPDPDGDGLVTLYFDGHQVASTDNVNQHADNRSHIDVRKLFADVRLENGSTVDRVEVVVPLDELDRHPETGELNFLEKRQGDNNTTIRTLTVVMSDGQRFTIKDSSPTDFREQDTSKVGDGTVGSTGPLNGESFTPEHGDIFVETNSSIDLVYAGTSDDAPDGDNRTHCVDGSCFDLSTFRQLGGENLMFTTRPEGFDPDQTNIFAIDVSDDTSDTYGDGLFSVNDAVLRFHDGTSDTTTTADDGDADSGHGNDCDGYDEENPGTSTGIDPDLCSTETAESNEATILNADPDGDGLIRLHFRPNQVASTDNINQRGDNRAHFDPIRRMDSVVLSNGSQVDFIEVVVPADETALHPGTDELNFLQKRQGDNNTTIQAINVVMTDGQVFEVKGGSTIDFREQDTSKVGDGTLGALGPLHGDSFTPHHGDTFVETNSAVDMVYAGTNIDAPADPDRTEFYHLDGNNWMFTSNPSGLDMTQTNVMAIDISDDTSDAFGDGLFTVTNDLLAHAGDRDFDDRELDYQNECNAQIREVFGDSDDGTTARNYAPTEVFKDPGDFFDHDELGSLANLRAQCEQARRDGVVVYTVGIDTPPEVADEIEACASSPAHAFDITASETEGVVKSIANAIRRDGLRQ
ncbi:Tad domain-containing protein [Roseovarius sp. SYSU LYC5161]|uniref:Tad domain-containing protein n=1 Tax=Roseovarius halophilus (ex Wu et al. 2025) TaxID=3376060 RepID=UPI00399B4EB8